MNLWGYYIYNRLTNAILHSDFGYETEADAEADGIDWMKSKAVSNSNIQTYQEWMDLDV